MENPALSPMINVPHSSAYYRFWYSEAIVAMISEVNDLQFVASGPLQEVFLSDLFGMVLPLDLVT